MSDREFSGSDDLTLPKATIQKIVTEILGDKSGLTFGKDARDLLIDCSVEFISLVSSEANDIAEREAKKTIGTEHIDKALRELGFPEYVPEVLASAGEEKEKLKGRDKKKNKWARPGTTDEKLLEEQEQVFAAARQQFLSGATGAPEG